MAELNEPSSDNLDARMRGFGLEFGEEEAPVVTEEGKDDKETEEQEAGAESGEPEEVDASEDTDDDTTESDAADDADDGEDEDNSDLDLKGQLKAEQKLRKEAESESRKFQSESDKKVQQAINRQNAEHQSDMKELWDQFETLKQEQTDGNAPSLGDDELVTGKDLKAIQAKPTIQQRKGGDASKPDLKANAWLQAQPDFAEVSAYIRDNDLSNDSTIAAIPTDTVGLFSAVRARIATEKVEEVETLKADLKKAQTDLKKANKKSKGKVPPTGGTGASGRNKGQSAEQPLTPFEKQFFGTARRKGFEPTIRIQR